MNTHRLFLLSSNFTPHTESNKTAKPGTWGKSQQLPILYHTRIKTRPESVSPPHFKGREEKKRKRGTCYENTPKGKAQKSQRADEAFVKLGPGRQHMPEETALEALQH